MRWSNEGEAALRNGSYRMISPVWEAAADTSRAGGANYVRPTRLVDVALTNQPNLPVPLISNRANNRQPPLPPNIMPNIAKLLGLPEAASADEIAAALQALQAKKTALEAEVQALKDVQVESDLAANSDVVKDEDKEHAKALLNANRSAALALFASARARLGGKSPRSPAGETLANRGATAPKTTAGTAAPVKTLAQQQAEAVEATRLQNRCSFAEAWDQTRRQKPELFQGAEPA